MNKIAAFVFISISLLQIACASQAPTASPPTAATATAALRKTGTLRLSSQGAAGVGDIPTLMATDSLKAQGYDVEFTNFSTTDLIPTSLLRGDLDIGSVNTTVSWAAMSKGANLRTILSKTNMTFYLVAKNEIQACRDLNNRSIGFNSTKTFGYVMSIEWIKKNCPGTTPQILSIPDTPNRLAAMQAGQLDASYLDIDSWLELNRRLPGQHHILINFVKEFPDIQFSSFTVQRDWAQQHSEMVKDFVRAILTANRQVIDDPKLLEDEIAKRLSRSDAEAKEAADAYLAQKVWDPDGGYTPETTQATLTFLAGSGSIPATLKSDDVVDLSYLNAVLDEIGRR